MNKPPKVKPEFNSLKKAFITASVALYLQSCHLQYEEEADALMLSFLIANAGSGQNSNGNKAGDGANTGNTSLGNTGGGDDDDSDHNLGSSLVNNTGQVASDSEFTGVGNTDVHRKQSEKTGQKADEADMAATSPGGTGESRIIGGSNTEDGEIDWTDAVDDGTKDADAATG
jgi:hypothetical protein